MKAPLSPPKGDINVQQTHEAPSEAVGEASRLYQQGNAYRKQGLWHEAINCYIEAARIDPDSPAVEAKRMLDDILNFYHKDAYNP